MINFIRMKRNEWKVKAMFYAAIATLFDNQKEILEMLQKVYVSLKDVPAEELQKELIDKLAEIIHNENKDK
ncbi:MAG: hypothetical protein HDR24_09265 [Lachnospiraceae bacterium]|nr:hypothetical protein [Lachnospiraceae bacterium]